MEDWSTLFGSYLNSGVHRVDAELDEAALQQAATAAGLDFTRIDVHRVHGKQAFLAAVASALEFPEYFGMNWDALHDCLTDMSWRRAEGYVLVLSGLEQLADAPDFDVELATRLLASVADYWKQREVPFHIVLSG